MDFYKHVKKTTPVKNPNFNKSHCISLPTRILINGCTGSGKTNTLMELIHKLGSVFMKIAVCLKTRDEPLYELLNDRMNGQVSFYEGRILVDGSKSKKQQNVPSLNDWSEKDDKGYVPSLIIFDDITGDSHQDRIIEYFIRARKMNITCVYLSQSYYETPKTIRQQCEYVILKRGASPKDLKYLLREHATNMTMEEMTRAYHKCCTDHTDFMLINIPKQSVHHCLSVEPMGTGVPTIEDVKEEPIVQTRQRAGRRTKYVTAKDTLARESCDLFMDVLKEMKVDDDVLFSDIHESYKNWCKTNGLVEGGRNLLGKELKRNFTDLKKNGSKYYRL